MRLFHLFASKYSPGAGPKTFGSKQLFLNRSAPYRSHVSTVGFLLSLENCGFYLEYDPGPTDGLAKNKFKRQKLTLCFMGWDSGLLFNFDLADALVTLFTQ